MEPQTHVITIIQRLRAEGRIAPNAKLSCRGLSSGIKVDGKWIALDHLATFAELRNNPDRVRQTPQTSLKSRIDAASSAPPIRR